ncbi:MAG: heme-binding domain-containing protein [Marinifilaceae bacterium]
MILKSPLKIFLIALLLSFCLIQFWTIDTSQPNIEINREFLHQTKAPLPVIQILKKACYDCHSFEVSYPWYSRIAPLSWLVENHVMEGIEHLNFSEWGSLSYGNQRGLLQESIREIEKGEMPIWSYRVLHPESKLNKEEIDLLKEWMQQVAKSLPESEELEY